MSEESELLEREEFLSLVQGGAPAEIAAYTVGWTPRKLESVLANDGFMQLFEAAVSMRDLAIEEVLYTKAKSGLEWAVKLWLFNRTPERWKDAKTVKVEGNGGELSPALIQATVDSVRTGILDALRDPGAVAAMQRPALGMPIIDAEVIEDGGEVEE